MDNSWETIKAYIPDNAEKLHHVLSKREPQDQDEDWQYWLPNHQSLSPGAKGGIAAGVIVGVLMIVLLAWFVWRRRRQRRGETQGALAIPPMTHEQTFSVPQTTPPEERQQTLLHGCPYPTSERRISLLRDEPGPPRQAVASDEIFLAPDGPRTTDTYPHSSFHTQPHPALEPNILSTDNHHPSSYDYRSSLLPGQAVTIDESPSTVPRKPLTPSPPQLDGRPIHEAANLSSPIREYHELDGGPVFGKHQQAIHSEN